MVSEKSIEFFFENWNNYFYRLKKGHIMVSPVTILKNWHWTFSPNRRHQLILKFVASVFKAADLPTSNQDHARKIAAYAALIEVRVYQSTESPADYYRTVVEVFKTALNKVVERRRMRLEHEATQAGLHQSLPVLSVISQRPPPPPLQELLQQPNSDFGIVPSPTNVISPPVEFVGSFPVGKPVNPPQQQQPLVSNGTNVQESDVDFLRKSDICLKV
jgi:hypothetical protein